MSTRCNIHFDQEGETIANIYRHSDGYPEAVLPDLQEFFAAVQEQTLDTRFSDPSYLAAKFVVWQAERFSRSGRPLNFLSLGIVNEDAKDGEWVYTVHCHNKWNEPGFPKVTHRKAGIFA